MLIYDQIQQVRPLHGVPLHELRLGDNSPLQPLVERRLAILEALDTADNHAQSRRREVQGEVEQARHTAVVTSDSSPVAVATAQAVLGAAPGIVERIDSKLRTERGRLENELRGVEANLSREAQPMLQPLTAYNLAVNNYLTVIKRLTFSAKQGRIIGSHESWPEPNIILAGLKVQGEFFIRGFAAVIGRDYDNEYGEIFK